MALSEMCKFIRDAMNLSQKALAQKIGTNQTEVSFIERGFIPNDEEKINGIYRLYFECMQRKIQNEQNH